jgi:hypothetical protein
MKTEIIRDSFLNGRETEIVKCGNAYFFSFPPAIAQHAKAIATISDWSDGKKPATQVRLRDLFQRLGMVCETRYDAAHGRRYKLCVYPIEESSMLTHSARRTVIAASDGMSDTNPEIARPVFQED